MEGGHLVAAGTVPDLGLTLNMEAMMIIWMFLCIKCFAVYDVGIGNLVIVGDIHHHLLFST